MVDEHKRHDGSLSLVDVHLSLPKEHAQVSHAFSDPGVMDGSRGRFWQARMESISATAQVGSAWRFPTGDQACTDRPACGRTTMGSLRSRRSQAHPRDAHAGTPRPGRRRRRGRRPVGCARVQTMAAGVLRDHPCRDSLSRQRTPRRGNVNLPPWIAGSPPIAAMKPNPPVTEWIP